MKNGTSALLALAVMALSSTASLAAPSAPAPPSVPIAGGKPVDKGGVQGPHKTTTIRCPATTDDGSGLPALNITPINLPSPWRVGSTTAIRLMSATLANGKLTCAYGGLSGDPAIRTTKVLPPDVGTCSVLADKTVSCVL